ncbi:MAG TPA: dethiobiotin synthase [Burkholderiales bacterium]|nr:dethiobiotin synthase [Burkholderiales bacterium]
MKLGYFVTGTDTGVGKTAVACALIRAFSRLGKRTAGMKPVSSGGDDTSRLTSAGGIELPDEVACPCGFSEPVAPHIAARHEGKKIEIGRIVHAYESIDADVVIVEGIGGFLVPLDENLDTSAIPMLLDLPVILVVGMRLGAINHALLTRDAIESRGLLLSGWIANRIDPEMQASGEVLESIEARMKAPLLAVLPYDPEEKFEIDLSKLVSFPGSRNRG